MTYLGEIINVHDIVCIQETKGPIKVTNYRAFNNNREWGARAGGGVAILVKNTISNGVSKIGTSLTPDAIAIKLNKNYFRLNRDIYIVSIYISPKNSLYRKRQTYDPWERINEFINSLKDKGDLIVCGDTNAHTNNLDDYIIDSDKDFLDLPKTFFPSSEKPPPRNNCDDKSCSDGKELMDLCISCDLQIVNGRKIGVLYGKKTYFGKLGSSCVD